MKRFSLAALALLCLSFTSITATQQAPAVDADDLGGVVRSSKGPEAGVWVIAETKDLPTPYAKIVVTDDQGRYLLPDLPKGNYSVFVRGYGLVDSPRVNATPGKALNLTAVIAPNEHAAAQYYPAGYWLSMLRIPEAGEFPGTGPQRQRHLAECEEPVRLGAPDQVGRLHGLSSTRHQRHARDSRRSSAASRRLVAAWDRRIQSGQAGGNMVGGITQLGKERALLLFADWTDRVNRGEVPPAPPRPQGVERNVVITMWDWADPKSYLHDVVSTDRRNPTLNANGLLYGALELSSDYTPVLNPNTHTISRIPLTVRDREYAADLAENAGAVAVLGRGSDLDQQEQRPQPDARREGTLVADLRGARRRRIPRGARKARRIRRRRRSRCSATDGSLRCTTRRRRRLRTSTPASARIT